MLVALPTRFVDKLLKGYLNILLKLHLEHIYYNEAITDRLLSKNEEVYTEVYFRAIPSTLQQIPSACWEKEKEIQIVIFLVKEYVDCKLLGKGYSHSSLTIKYLLQNVQQSYHTSRKPV